MTSSRDGSQVWFTVDSPSGFSRVFKMVGWGKNGAGATPNTFYTPTDDWALLDADYSFQNNFDNFGGVVNMFWLQQSPAQPVLKGIALTPTFGAVCGPGSFLNAAAGGQCTLCPANTFSASPNSASCAPCTSTSMYASAIPGSATCACPANFVAGGSGASLTCSCPAGAAQSGAVCTPCAAGQYSTAAGAAACSPCGVNSYSVAAGSASCAACPPGATSSGAAPCVCSAAQGFVAAAGGGGGCMCAAGYSSLGTSGASLTCTACPAGSTSVAGELFCTCSGAYATFQPGSNACVTSPSPSVTPSQTSTVSVSATPSTTATFTPSGSVTATPTQTPTPSITPSQTASQTASQTPSNSPTASVTPVADTVLVFSFVFKTSDGSPLNAQTLSTSPAVWASIATNVGAATDLSPYSIRVVNVTDVATSVIYATGQRRALAADAPAGRALAAAAPGSLGVAFGCTANLGKGATAAGIARVQSALVSNINATSPAAAAIGASVATNLNLPPSTRLVAVPPAASSLQVSGPGAALMPSVVIDAAGGVSDATVVKNEAITGVIVAVLIAGAAVALFARRQYLWNQEKRRDAYELKARGAREAEERFNQDTVPVTLNPLDDALGGAAAPGGAAAAKVSTLTLRVPKAVAAEVDKLRARSEQSDAELQAARRRAREMEEELALLRAGGSRPEAAAFAPLRVGSEQAQAQAQAPAAAAGVWNQVTDPNSGRPYWYNTATKETSWVKPF